MGAGRMMKAVAVAVVALSTLLLLEAVTLGEVYAFILVGDGNWDVSGWNPERDSFYRGASSIDDAFKEGWGIDPAHIAFVQAWESSATEVFVRLSSMVQEVAEDDVFVFYYVGHGDRDAMMPWRGEGAALFGYDTLGTSFLDEIEGEKVLILDCCYAGTAHDDVGTDTWVIASCGDERNLGIIFDSFFSNALAIAITNGATGVREAYGNAEHVWWHGNLSEIGQTPHLYSPFGVGGNEDLDIAEAATATPKITSFAISGSMTDITGVSASGAAAGSASCNVTLELDSVSGEYRAICDYSLQAAPARGRGSAHVSIRVVVPILLPLGSIELHASMDAEGAVRYGVFPNAQSDYAPGTMQGDIVIGGVRESFTGSGQMQGQTSGTSAQDVEVTLWFDMEANL